AALARRPVRAARGRAAAGLERVVPAPGLCLGRAGAGGAVPRRDRPRDAGPLDSSPCGRARAGRHRRRADRRRRGPLRGRSREGRAGYACTLARGAHLGVMARQPTEDRSVRLLKVGERVRHLLSEVLTAHQISVTEVRMSPDLRLARVYVKPLLGSGEEDVLQALRRNTAYLQREVAQRLGLKFAPRLRFTADESFDEAGRIERLLS